MRTTRRSFLKQMTALSAAPFILPSTIWSAEVKPNDRLVMGFIGMGKQSRGLLSAFLNHRNCQVVAVCDVDTTRRMDAQQRVNEYYKTRPEKGTADCAACVWISGKLLGVMILMRSALQHPITGMPSLPSALQSGKDVYCEKLFDP